MSVNKTCHAALVLGLLIGPALLASSCPATSAATCRSSDDCGRGEVCFEEQCRTVCNVATDCDSGLSCVHGICMQAPARDAALADAAHADAAPADAAAGDAVSVDAPIADVPGIDAAVSDAVSVDAARADAARADAAGMDAAAPDTAAPDTATCEDWCSGCCQGQVCQPNTYPLCGVSGASCEDCASTFGERADACDPSGECSCAATGARCLVGQRCAAEICCHPDHFLVGPAALLDPDVTDDHVIVPLDATRFLDLYQGKDGQHWGVILTVAPGQLAVSAGSPQAFATTSVDYLNGAALQVDADHVLVVYPGASTDAYAALLSVDPDTDSIQAHAAHEFNGEHGVFFSLARIDDVRFLCAYQSGGDIGHAVVLSVDLGSMTVSSGPDHSYGGHGQHHALARVDDTHYLDVYNGTGQEQSAVVLTVDLDTDEISRGPRLSVAAGPSGHSKVAEVGGGLFLNVYGDNGRGEAALLEVDTGTNSVALLERYTFDATSGAHVELLAVDAERYAMLYSGADDTGQALLLHVELTGATALSSSHATVIEPDFYNNTGVALVGAERILTSFSDATAQGQARVLALPCAD